MPYIAGKELLYYSIKICCTDSNLNWKKTRMHIDNIRIDIFFLIFLPIRCLASSRSSQTYAVPFASSRRFAVQSQSSAGLLQVLCAHPGGCKNAIKKLCVSSCASCTSNGNVPALEFVDRPLHWLSLANAEVEGGREQAGRGHSGAERGQAESWWKVVKGWVGEELKVALGPDYIPPLPEVSQNQVDLLGLLLPQPKEERKVSPCSVVAQQKHWVLSRHVNLPVPMQLKVYWGQ